MAYPRMLRVRQRFEAPRVRDVAAAVRGELERIGIRRRIAPSRTVAITAGSRGITDIALVIRTLVAVLKEIGARPFIVPAMGSHGGATAEGQQKILEGLGITEAATGAPIRASMDTVELGATADGIPLHFDRAAHEADHVAIVGRVKPHTNFSGEIESGLLKMATIGLGKHAGAAAYHRAIVDHSFDHVARTAGRMVIERGRIAFGLALLENGHDATAMIEAVPPESFEEREKALLVLAKRWLPRLPVLRPDLLIVDQMGKDISGSGMDTNVVGRKPHGGGERDPRVKRLFVRDLTPGTRGNGYGIGLADFTTSRLVQAIDRHITALNCLTAAHPEAAAIPIHFATDRAAIDAALSTIGLAPPERARIVRIRNTLALAELDVAEICRAELLARGDAEIVEPPRELAFDAADNLLPFDAQPFA
ncbi:MAG TPA: lactate racemase domain-containing protein [Candidatus Binatus sp.]|nr:lactate racemase domain-containing protein [Candidatus Binatus sp.]